MSKLAMIVYDVEMNRTMTLKNWIMLYCMSAIGDESLQSKDAMLAEMSYSLDADDIATHEAIRFVEDSDTIFGEMMTFAAEIERVRGVK